MDDDAGFAGDSSLAGAWVLDIDRSDTTVGYLRCMRLPDIVIMAQISTEQSHESRNVISIEDPTLVIHKRTGLNVVTETYELDTDMVTQIEHGERLAIASLLDWGQQDGLVITTTMPTAGGEVRLVETRQLLAGGQEHTQMLDLNNNTTGEQSVTRRTWIRVEMTQLDRAQIVP